MFTLTQVLSELTQFALWVVSAVKYTTSYADWDCFDPTKLLEQYSRGNYTNITMLFNEAFTVDTTLSGSMDSISLVTGITNTTMLTEINEGMLDFFDALEVSSLTVSGLGLDGYIENQRLIANLSFDCQLKKGAFVVSWIGVGFYVLFGVVYVISCFQETSCATEEVFPFVVESVEGINGSKSCHEGLVRDDKVMYTVTQAIFRRDGSFAVQFVVTFFGHENHFFMVVTCDYDRATESLETMLSLEKVVPGVPMRQVFRSNVPLSDVRVKFKTKRREDKGLETGGDQKSCGNFWFERLSGDNRTDTLSTYDFKNFGCLLMDLTIVKRGFGDTCVTDLAQIVITGHERALRRIPRDRCDEEKSVDSKPHVSVGYEPEDWYVMHHASSPLQDYTDKPQSLKGTQDDEPKLEYNLVPVTGETRYIIPRSCLSPRRLRVLG